MTPAQKENLLKIRAIALAFAALPINLWRYFTPDGSPQCLLGHYFGTIEKLEERLPSYCGTGAQHIFGLTYPQCNTLFGEGNVGSEDPDEPYTWSSGHACVKYIDSIIEEAEANGQAD